MNTLDEIFDETTIGSKSKIKILKKKVKSAKAILQQKKKYVETHTQNTSDMNAGLLSSLEQLHASVLTDIDASKARHVGEAMDDNKVDATEAKPWMKRVKKASNPPSEPTHNVIPVLKPPVLFPKSTDVILKPTEGSPSSLGCFQNIAGRM